MRILTCLPLWLVMAGPALAVCGADETTVLDCTTRGGRNTLNVCLSGETIRYAYGPRGAVPELQLTDSVTGVEHRPWAGIGRAIWESTTFRNAGYAYEVFLSVDRMSENPGAEGGVTVSRGDEVLATVTCDPGQRDHRAVGRQRCKKALGICRDPAKQAWVACD